MNTTKPRTWRRTLTTLLLGAVAGAVTITAMDSARANDSAPPPGQTVTIPVEVTFYEDGSWSAGEEAGCAPTALCND